MKHKDIKGSRFDPKSFAKLRQFQWDEFCWVAWVGIIRIDTTYRRWVKRQTVAADHGMQRAVGAKNDDSLSSLHLFVGQTSSGKWYYKGTNKYLSNSGLEDIVEVGMVPEEGPVHRHHHLPAISIEPILGIFELWYSKKNYSWGGILVRLVICVIPGHWKLKILNMLKYRNIDSFSAVHIIHDEKKMMGHLIWPIGFLWSQFLKIWCPGMTN